MPSFQRRHILAAVVGVLVVAVAAAITVLTVGRDHDSADPPWPRSILFYGDSLTRGLYTSAPDRTFPAVVGGALAHNGTRPTSATVADYGIDVQEFLRRTPTPPSTADLYVVELGTNDVGKTAAATFDSAYGRLLDSLGAVAPRGLVCLGPWTLPAISGPVASAVEQQCTQHGGQYVAIADLYADPANRGPAGRVLQGLPTDDVHPNDTGHGAIARLVVDAVDRLRSATR